MESNKAEQKITVIILLCVILLPIIITNIINERDSSSSDNYSLPEALPEPFPVAEEPASSGFFEGIIAPGELNAKCVRPLEDKESQCVITQTLTIGEDLTFYLTEAREFPRFTEFAQYEGKILDKHTEKYNGVDHIWYTLEGKDSDRGICHWSIEKDGHVIDTLCSTYSAFYTRLTDDISNGVDWAFTRNDNVKSNQSTSTSPASDYDTPKQKSIGTALRDGDVKYGMTYDQIAKICGTGSEYRVNGVVRSVTYYLGMGGTTLYFSDTGRFYEYTESY